MDRSALSLLCQDILSSEKTVVLGRMRTSTAAEKLRMNLTGLGVTALSASDTLAFQHLLYIINENTCVIMFSTTGEITDQLEFLKQQKEQSARVWLITPARKPKMAAWADHTIAIPAVKSGTTFAGSQTVMMAFADILTALMEDIIHKGG
jgi:DNA-binding MurR/RpiR family transcriptional regulator